MNIKFNLLAFTKKKPFVISKEFVKEIIESRPNKAHQEQIATMAKEFENNNLKGPVKEKRK